MALWKHLVYISGYPINVNEEKMNEWMNAIYQNMEVMVEGTTPFEKLVHVINWLNRKNKNKKKTKNEK